MGKFFDLMDRVLILDGAWGTEFQKLGLAPGESCERLNLEAPEKVVSVAGGYVEAGSDIILTNSFQGNPFTLARHGLADHVFEVNRSAVELSRRAAGDKARVFASLGPSGKMLMTGEISEDDLLAGFAEQVKGLAAGGPDGIVLETFADLAEWKLAARAVKDHSHVPVVGCLTFDSGPESTRTMMGVSVAEAAAAAEALALDAVGANCGLGIDGYAAIAKRYLDTTHLPLWIKANAGLPVQQGDHAVYTQTPAAFAEQAAMLIDLGVRFLGGCCGTTPEHIRQLVQMVRDLDKTA